MKRRMLITAVLVPIVVLALAYAAFPWIAVPVAAAVAARHGVQIAALEVERPGWNGVHVRRAALAVNGTTLDLADVEVRYRPIELLGGELAAVRVGSLDVAVGGGDEAGPFVLPRPDRLWQALPAPVVVVEHMNVELAEPVMTVDGRLAVADGRATASLRARTPAYAHEVHMALTLARDGTLTVAADEIDGDSSASIVAAIEADVMAISAEVHARGLLLALVSRMLGAAGAHGTVDVSAQGRIPLPFTFETVSAGGRATIAWQGRYAGYDVEIDAEALSLDTSAGALTVTGDLDVHARRDGLDAAVRIAKVSADASGARLELARARFVTGGYGIEQRETTHWRFDVGARHVSLEDGERGAAFGILLPRLELGAATVSADDAGARLVALEADAAGAAHGRATLSATPVVRTKGGQVLRPRLAGELQARYEEGATATLSVTAPWPLEAALAPGAQGSLEVEVDGSIGIDGALLAEALRPEPALGYDLYAGTLELSADFTLADQGLAGSASLVFDDVSGHYGQTIFGGISARPRVDLATMQLPRTHLDVDTIDIGFPITDVDAAVTANAEHVVVEDVAARLLGGHARIERIDYDFDTASAAFVVQLDSLDLPRVLALEGGDLFGTGTLSGMLPVRIRGSTVTIEGGTIEAAPGGGIVRYADAETAAEAIGQAMGFALTALSNFHYERLDVGVDYRADGTLALAIRLEGRNANVREGRPIHYNLNVTQNLPALLKSLTLTSKMGQRIEERLGE